MNAPREGVYDRVTAGALVKGAAACYGDEAAMRLWGRTQGCEECQVVRDERTDTLAFAAANETEVFVCFRGTRDLRNWITDLDCGLTSASSVEPRIADCGLEGGIHAGFYRALEAVWGELAAVLERMAAGRKNIFFCGHSLGGALAMLAAARWEGRGGAGNSAAISGSLPRAATWMYSFGQPRVGNRAWARWYDARLRQRSFRIVHAEDVVARVPWLLGMFRHAGTEVFHDAQGVEHVDWPWICKLRSDARGLWEEWKCGQVALLGDHRVSTYVELLNRQNFSRGPQAAAFLNHGI
jgi:triacylglycerol lipase